MVRGWLGDGKDGTGDGIAWHNGIMHNSITLNLIKRNFDIRQLHVYIYQFYELYTLQPTQTILQLIPRFLERDRFRRGRRQMRFSFGLKKSVLGGFPRRGRNRRRRRRRRLGNRRRRWREFGGREKGVVEMGARHRSTRSRPSLQVGHPSLAPLQLHF